jgi:hypothetical protein
MNKLHIILVKDLVLLSFLLNFKSLSVSIYNRKSENIYGLIFVCAERN